MVTRISSIEGLNQIREDLEEDYIITDNIDASKTQGDNPDLEFKPIGSGEYAEGVSSGEGFRGSIEANGFTVSGLEIKPDSNGNAALFDYMEVPSNVRGLELENCTIGGQGSEAAPIARINDGYIAHCSITGTIKNMSHSDAGTGNPCAGVAARSNGFVVDCDVDATVQSDQEGSKVGGIVAINHGEIDRCTFSGSISSSATAGGIADTDLLPSTEHPYVIENQIVRCLAHSDATIEANNASGIAHNSDGHIDISKAACSITADNNAAMVAMSASEITRVKGSGDISAAGTSTAFVGELDGAMTESFTEAVFNNGEFGHAFIQTQTSNGSVEYSYWNTDVISTTTSDGGQGVSSDQLTASNPVSGLSNWETEVSWIIQESDTPVLQTFTTFEIASFDDLSLIRDYHGANFVLTSDIDATHTENETYTGANGNEQQGFKPLGSETSEHFAGVIEGNGHTIDGIYTSTTSDNRSATAFIRHATSAIIRNLTIKDFYVHSDMNSVSCLLGEFSSSGVTDSTMNAAIRNVSAEGCTASGGSVATVILAGCYTWNFAMNNISVDNCTVEEHSGASSFIVSETYGSDHCFMSNVSITNSNLTIPDGNSAENGAVSYMLSELGAVVNTTIENTTVETGACPGIFASTTQELMVNGLNIKNCKVVNPHAPLTGDDAYSFLGYGGGIVGGFYVYQYLKRQRGMKDVTVDGLEIDTPMDYHHGGLFGEFVGEAADDISKGRCTLENVEATNVVAKGTAAVGGLFGTTWGANIRNVTCEVEVTQDGRGIENSKIEDKAAVSPLAYRIYSSDRSMEFKDVSVDATVNVNGYDSDYSLPTLNDNVSSSSESIVVGGLTNALEVERPLTVENVKVDASVNVLDEISHQVDVSTLVNDNRDQQGSVLNNIGVDLELNSTSNVRNIEGVAQYRDSNMSATTTLQNGFGFLNEPIDVSPQSDTAVEVTGDFYVRSGGNVDSSSGVTTLEPDAMLGSSAAQNMNLDFEEVWTDGDTTPELAQFITDILNIYVQVKDSYGNNLEGEAIGINGQPVATTDANGEFSVELDTGVAQELNWITAGIDKEIEKEKGQVEFNLQYLTIEGTITDVNGNETEGEAVVLDNKFMFETGPGGMYVAEDIPPQYYNARWVGGNVETLVGNTEGGVITEDFQYAGLNVTIEHPLKREPLPNTTVQVDNTLLTTDENGEATITELPVGEYRVTAMGFWDINTNEINQGVMKEVDFSGADLDLTVGVDVISRETGEPLEGVDVAITRANSMGETDSNGHCELFAAGLDEDPELIVASDDPRYATQIRQLHREEERMDFEIVLSKRTPMER